MSWVALLGAFDPNAISPDDYMGPLASAIVIYALFLLAPLVLILVTRLKSRRHARQAAAAEAAYRPDAPLVAGEATLFGTVEELPPGAEHAVRVEVEQEGSESEGSGGWSHSWTEKDRRVKVHPFYLRHASGRRIRVEPHREVLLVDAMDGVIRVDLTARVRVAELTPGEKVFAHGELQETVDAALAEAPGLYREAPLGFVLRPPRSGRMLLSTEPLGERFRRRARIHRSAARVFAWILLVFHLLLLPYHLRALAGTTVTGKVVGLKHYTTKDDDGVTHHYKVRIALPGGLLVDDHVVPGVFRSLRRETPIPVRRSPLLSALLSNVGPGAAAHAAAPGIGAVLWIILVVGYVIAARQKRWFEAPLVEGGSGRLEETLGSEDEPDDLVH